MDSSFDDEVEVTISIEMPILNSGEIVKKKRRKFFRAYASAECRLNNSNPLKYAHFSTFFIDLNSERGKHLMPFAQFSMHCSDPYGSEVQTLMDILPNKKTDEE